MTGNSWEFDGPAGWGYCWMTTAHSHPVLVRTDVAAPLDESVSAFERIVARLKAEGRHPGEWATFCVHPLREDGSPFGGRIRDEHSHGWYWMGPGLAPATYPRKSPRP